MTIPSFLDFLFPSHCVQCAAPLSGGSAICAACLDAIPLHGTLFCGTCRSRLPEPKKHCHKDTPYLLAAATDYENQTVRELIHALKFKFIRTAASPLGAITARYLEHLDIPLDGYSLVPIPLSKKRMRERGFNQSELIARGVADRFHLPLDTTSIIRTRHTLPQSEREDWNERKNNVAGCFLIVDNGAIAGKKILLVDDVTTSGATLREAAKSLKRAGARTVLALVTAKT